MCRIFKVGGRKTGHVKWKGIALPSPKLRYFYANSSTSWLKWPCLAVRTSDVGYKCSRGFHLWSNVDYTPGLRTCCAGTTILFSQDTSRISLFVFHLQRPASPYRKPWQTWRLWDIGYSTIHTIVLSNLNVPNQILLALCGQCVMHSSSPYWNCSNQVQAAGRGLLFLNASELSRTFRERVESNNVLFYPIPCCFGCLHTNLSSSVCNFFYFNESGQTIVVPNLVTGAFRACVKVEGFIFSVCLLML